MQLFDQNPDDALATGQSHTRFVSLSAAATNQPLRVTLVWTDPPGNPAASLKLVNNLDLVVTNLAHRRSLLRQRHSPRAAASTSPGTPTPRRTWTW